MRKGTQCGAWRRKENCEKNFSFSCSYFVCAPVCVSMKISPFFLREKIKFWNFSVYSAPHSKSMGRPSPWTETECDELFVGVGSFEKHTKRWLTANNGLSTHHRWKFGMNVCLHNLRQEKMMKYLLFGARKTFVEVANVKFACSACVPNLSRVHLNWSRKLEITCGPNDIWNCAFKSKFVVGIAGQIRHVARAEISQTSISTPFEELW